MTTTSTMTNWLQLLSPLSNNEKLSIINGLSASLLEKAKPKRRENATKQMLARYYGAWVGTESADEIMRVVRENASSSEPLSF